MEHNGHLQPLSLPFCHDVDTWQASSTLKFKAFLWTIIVFPGLLTESTEYLPSAYVMLCQQHVKHIDIETQSYLGLDNLQVVAKKIAVRHSCTSSTLLADFFFCCRMLSCGCCHASGPLPTESFDANISNSQPTGERKQYSLSMGC